MLLSRLDEIKDHLLFKITDATIAAGAMTYPLWRQALHDVSALMSDVTPIFGVAWLGVQIVCKVTGACGKRNNSHV